MAVADFRTLHVFIYLHIVHLLEDKYFQFNFRDNYGHRALSV
jgi:hypothetical protein